MQRKERERRCAQVIRDLASRTIIPIPQLRTLGTVLSEVFELHDSFWPIRKRWWKQLLNNIDEEDTTSADEAKPGTAERAYKLLEKVNEALEVEREENEKQAKQYEKHTSALRKEIADLQEELARWKGIDFRHPKK